MSSMLYYADSMINFLNDENSYYDVIRSFTSQKSTILRIVNKDNERISSAVLIFDDDEPYVLEVKRAFQTAKTVMPMDHNSIQDWYMSVMDTQDVLLMFEEVQIGEEKIPLWRVMETMSDDDNDDDENVVEEPVDEYNFMKKIILFLVAFQITLTFITLFLKYIKG